MQRDSSTHSAHTCMNFLAFYCHEKKDKEEPATGRNPSLDCSVSQFHCLLPDSCPQTCCTSLSSPSSLTLVSQPFSAPSLTSWFPFFCRLLSRPVNADCNLDDVSDDGKQAPCERVIIGISGREKRSGKPCACISSHKSGSRVTRDSERVKSLTHSGIYILIQRDMSQFIVKDHAMCNC